VGIRADDTFQALRGWLKAAGDAGVAADGLSAVIAQRLLRRLCPVCRQSFQPEPAALKKLNLPADRIQQLYKASGKIYEGNREQVCPSCNGLGFLGRTAAFEILVIDTTSRQLIKQGNFEQVRSHQRKNKMLMLQEAALAKVVAGETSITEVMRVLGNQ
jgi:type II secretory ATPase GspE/PulE/Tfp pilus assembly ATPase PilB-like protein